MHFIFTTNSAIVNTAFSQWYKYFFGGSCVDDITEPVIVLLSTPFSQWYKYFFGGSCVDDIFEPVIFTVGTMKAKFVTCTWRLLTSATVLKCTCVQMHEE